MVLKANPIDPAPRLPLAVRKNLRDEFEIRRTSLKAELSTLLSIPWNIAIDAVEIFAAADKDSYAYQSLGACITAYIQGAINQLKSFLGSEITRKMIREEINRVCYRHTLTMAADEHRSVSYCGCDVKNGCLRIVWEGGNLGTNIDYALQGLEIALNRVPVQPGSNEPTMSFSARLGIQKDWETGVAEVKRKIGQQLHNLDIILNPSFEEVYLKLKSGKVDERFEDWERKLGEFTLLYFQALLDTLEYNKFGDDKLLHEGFAEVVSGNEVKFALVKKLSQSALYNEVVVEGGVLVLQTTMDSWGVNISNVAEKLIDAFSRVECRLNPFAKCSILL